MKNPWTAHKIRVLRRKLGLNRTNFAHAAGVAELSVQRWESGRRSPSALAIASLERLAATLETKDLAGQGEKL